MRNILLWLLQSFLACTRVTALAQYCTDNTDPMSGFCVSMASFLNPSTTHMDLYLTIDMTDNPGEGWTAVGIGKMMAGSLLFVLATNEENETFLTIRTTTGHLAPHPDSNLLPHGKVISTKPASEGRKQISIVCSSCNEWADFDPYSQNCHWIWAQNTQQKITNADDKFRMEMHHSFGFFYVDMNAAIGKAGSAANSSPLDVSKGSFAASTEPLQRLVEQRPLPTRLHELFFGVAFMILYPAGVIVVRLRFTSWFWAHVAIQSLTSAVCTIGVVLQIISLSHDNMLKGALNVHTIVGAPLALLVFIQMLLGYWHHVKFAIKQRRSQATRIHVWIGRFLLAAGISNTGLGLAFANHSASILYAWGILAVFEMLILIIVLPSIEQRRPTQITDVSISGDKNTSNEAIAQLLGFRDEDSDV